MPSFLVSLALAALLSWGFLGDWFADDAEVLPPAPEAVDAIITVRLAEVGRHPALPAVYAERESIWRSPDARRDAAALLTSARADGIPAGAVEGPAVAHLRRVVAEAEQAWAALDPSARDTLADPRPPRLAALDLALTDGLLRLGDALRGRRADAGALYPGVWFPTVRDSTGAGFEALVGTLRDGDPAATEAALGALRPAHAGYQALRTRLAALAEDLPAVPTGDALTAGERSVRVPHLRHRLEALGFAHPDTVGTWSRPDAYLFSDSLAAALARFEAARGLDADGILDPAATAAVNADLGPLRVALALNLERWRWLPDDLGERYVWVNLPTFELTAWERDGATYAERLRMPANIGNAQTTGWTTPVISDSIHTVEFQPVWYVPRSLAAASVFPMARRDSLALWRQGFEVYQNGALVDSRLVPWDSVSVADFRFVQRPGPANPLGRVKFLMHNPHAILIHDTNRRHTLADGTGSTMSSGCVQAGAPDALAEYLLTTVNGWDAGQATRAWRRGPRRGVPLDERVRTHFVYFTATVDAEGGLRLHDDPYGYDPRLAEALGMTADDGPRTAEG